MILLNPGPANTTETVKQALVCPDICPRERSFGDTMERVRRRLTAVVHQGRDYETVLFCGSGTAAVEAALCSTVQPTGRLLVVDNGAYGARMAQIARAYNMPHDVEALGTGSYPRVEQIAERLRRTHYSHLAIVHHETSTGMLNPVEQVGALCRENGVEMVVDAMSSYAGLPIDIEGMGADYLVSSANKCIQGMAGLSFVVCKRSSLERLETIPGRSFYLNLGAQHRFFEAEHQMSFTPPVQVIYALEQALDELFAETLAGRHARYMACFEALDGGMRRLGFRRLLPEPMLSRILTAYIEPNHPGYSFERMHDSLLEQGFTIYPGKGAQQATFRLANMGAITPGDMHAFASAMAATIEEMGLVPNLYDHGD